MGNRSAVTILLSCTDAATVLSPMKHSKRPRRSRGQEHQSLERAVELYLQSCFAKRQAVRVSDFAAAVQQTRQQVSRRIVERTGLSVSDFLRKKQLAHAQHLLRTTGIPAEQIALASGFGSAWTFFRCFKDSFGVTPTEFRNVATSRE